MNENYQRAKALFDLGRYKESIVAVKECLREDTECRSALILLAAAFQGLNDKKSVQFWAREILRLDGNDPIGHYYLAGSLRIDKPNDALEHINAALAFNSIDTRFHTLKAIILRVLGQYHRALESVEDGLRIDSSNSWLLNERALILSGLDMRVESDASAKMALESEPYDWRVFYYSSRSAFNNGQFKKAIDSLKEAIKLNPSNELLRLCYPLYLKRTSVFVGATSALVNFKVKSDLLQPTLKNIILMPILVVYIAILSVLALIPWYLDSVKESIILAIPKHRRYLTKNYKIVFRVNVLLLILAMSCFCVAILNSQVNFLNASGLLFFCLIAFKMLKLNLRKTKQKALFGFALVLNMVVMISLMPLLSNGLFLGSLLTSTLFIFLDKMRVFENFIQSP